MIDHNNDYLCIIIRIIDDENERLTVEYDELYHEMSTPVKSGSIVSTELNILNEMYYNDSLKNMK